MPVVALNHVVHTNYAVTTTNDLFTFIIPLQSLRPGQYRPLLPRLPPGRPVQEIPEGGLQLQQLQVSGIGIFCCDVFSHRAASQGSPRLLIHLVWKLGSCMFHLTCTPPTRTRTHPLTTTSPTLCAPTHPRRYPHPPIAQPTPPSTPPKTSREVSELPTTFPYLAATTPTTATATTTATVGASAGPASAPAPAAPPAPRPAGVSWAKVASGSANQASSSGGGGAQGGAEAAEGGAAPVTSPMEPLGSRVRIPGVLSAAESAAGRPGAPERERAGVDSTHPITTAHPTPASLGVSGHHDPEPSRQPLHEPVGDELDAETLAEIAAMEAREAAAKREAMGGGIGIGGGGGASGQAPDDVDEETLAQIAALEAKEAAGMAAGAGVAVGVAVGGGVAAGAAGVAAGAGNVWAARRERRDQEQATLAASGARGLQNMSGEYNCFINVVIQCLWHIQGFR